MIVGTACVFIVFAHAVIGLDWTHHGVQANPRRGRKISSKASSLWSEQTSKHWCDLNFSSDLTQPHLCPGAPLTPLLGQALESRKLLECIWEVSDVIHNSCWVETYWTGGVGGGEKVDCGPTQLSYGRFVLSHVSVKLTLFSILLPLL